MGNWVLGLDISGHHCGYAVLGSKCEIKTRGCIEPPGEYWSRQNDIVTNIEVILDKYPPIRVVFERVRLFHQGKINLASIEDLARLSGAIGLVTFRRGIPIETVHTSHYRKRVLGDGRAKKEAVVQWVKDKYGFKTFTTDEAEAIAIATFGVLLNGNGKNGKGKS